ncbi:MAG: KilA-N domain-containing protein [Saprospiraceae bacterium]
MSKIKVNNVEITVISTKDQDFICLTDMARGQEGEQHIRNWFRTKSTLEYLAVWERLNNPSFNMAEFDLIRIEAGSNKFLMSGNQWKEKTNAIGIISKTGRYGGTYAHRDIAFHFAMWLSPEFQLLVVKEYQLFKEQRASSQNLEWNFRRFLTKANYKIHTDAVKEFSIPISSVPENNQWIIYAEEADLLNMAVFGCTAKEWRDTNGTNESRCDNIRDCADAVQLLVLANLESLSAHLLSEGKSKEERFKALFKKAQTELQSLYRNYTDLTSIESPNKVKSGTNISTTLDKNLKGLLSGPQQKKN